MAESFKTSRLPAETAAPLGILVEAAAAPELFKARHILGSRLEQAEALDALSHGAATLPHLMWEWALYSGHIPVSAGLRGTTPPPIDNSLFHATLGAIARYFPLQYSMPLPSRGKGRAIVSDDWWGWRWKRLRPSAKDRLHLVERTTFEEISFGKPEDVSDKEIEEAVRQAETSGTVPYFEEPALRPTRGTHVGVVWVRVLPEIMRAYREAPAILYSLVAKIHRLRLTQLRQHIAAADPPLRARETEQLNTYIGSEMQVLDMFEGASIRLQRASRASGRRLRKRVAGVAGSSAPARQRSAPTVFISYSHADAKHQGAIRQHLALLEREGRAKIWWDERVQGGGLWKREIASALDRASVVVLLVSRHFLSSTYCYEIEMEKALRKAARGVVRVIPAIVGTCGWKRTPLIDLLAVPRDGRPVTSFRNRDDAYMQIADSVEQAVTKVSLRRKRASGTA